MELIFPGNPGWPLQLGSWSCPSANLFIVTCKWRKPWTPQWLRTKSSAHLLRQERFLNLEDLIQPQNSKLTYIKVHLCSTLHAVLYEVASDSSSEWKNPQRWTEAFSGQLYQSRKDYMRQSWSNWWFIVHLFLEADVHSGGVFVVQWNKPSFNYETSKGFPSSKIFFSPHQCLLSPFLGSRKSRGCLQSLSQSSGLGAVTRGQRFRSLSELVAPATTLP